MYHVKKFQEDLPSSFGGVVRRRSGDNAKKNNNNTREKTNGAKTIRFPLTGES